jgi:Tfp pilus assembly protein PilZ
LKLSPRRKYPRVGVSFPVDYSIGQSSFREHASTLGGGGLFISTQQTPAVGTELALHFRPAKHLPVLDAKAKVVYHVSNRGIAVEFTEIQPEYRQLLLHLIHHRVHNKRKFVRAPLVTQVAFKETMSLAFSRDVGAGGMFIETSTFLDIGTQITLRFNLDDKGPIIVAQAAVSYHVSGLGMGVQFSEIDPEAQRRIEAYVSRSMQPLPAKKGPRTRGRSQRLNKTY